MAWDLRSAFPVEMVFHVVRIGTVQALCKHSVEDGELCLFYLTMGEGD